MHSRPFQIHRSRCSEWLWSDLCGSVLGAWPWTAGRPRRKLQEPIGLTAIQSDETISCRRGSQLLESISTRSSDSAPSAAASAATRLRRGFGDLILDSGRRLKWPTSRESNSIAFEEASHPHRSLAPDEKNTTHTTVRNRPPETVESKEFGWHRIDVGLARFSVSRESFAQPTHWCCRVVAELAKR